MSNVTGCARRYRKLGAQVAVIAPAPRCKGDIVSLAIMAQRAFRLVGAVEVGSAGFQVDAIENLFAALAGNNQPPVRDLDGIEREIICAFLRPGALQPGDAAGAIGGNPHFGPCDANMLDLQVAGHERRQAEANLQALGVKAAVTDRNVACLDTWARQKPCRQIAFDLHRGAEQLAGAGLEKAPVAAPVDKERSNQRGNQRGRYRDTNTEQKRIHTLATDLCLIRRPLVYIMQ
ncbi:MAG: hypothetical protein R3D43_00990 [Tepidamorphaceae bacterium]